MNIDREGVTKLIARSNCTIGLFNFVRESCYSKDKLMSIIFTLIYDNKLLSKQIDKYNLTITQQQKLVCVLEDTLSENMAGLKHLQTCPLFKVENSTTACEYVCGMKCLMEEVDKCKQAGHKWHKTCFFVKSDSSTKKANSRESDLRQHVNPRSNAPRTRNRESNETQARLSRSTSSHVANGEVSRNIPNRGKRKLAASSCTTVKSPKKARKNSSYQNKQNKMNGLENHKVSTEKFAENQNEKISPSTRRGRPKRTSNEHGGQALMSKNLLSLNKMDPVVVLVNVLNDPAAKPYLENKEQENLLNDASSKDNEDDTYNVVDEVVGQSEDENRESDYEGCSSEKENEKEYEEIAADVDISEPEMYYGKFDGSSQDSEDDDKNENNSSDDEKIENNSSDDDKNENYSSDDDKNENNFSNDDDRHGSNQCSSEKSSLGRGDIFEEVDECERDECD